MPAKQKAEPTVDRRGQLEIELQGVPYGLRPSFPAIEAIEAKIGPLGDLVAALQADRLPIAKMGEIATELMRAFAEAHPNLPNIRTYRGLTAKKVSELIYEQGSGTVRIPLFCILLGAITGGYDASGEAKAEGKKTMATPAAGN